MPIPKPKTLTKEDKAVIAGLNRAASKPLTKQEVDAQRISWAFGNLPSRSTITRDEVIKFLKARAGE